MDRSLNPFHAWICVGRLCVRDSNECEATGLGLHFVCTLGAMMTEYVYCIGLYVLFTIEVAIGYFLLLYFIALQNITNRGAPNQFPPPLRHNLCSAPGR